ncbi:MAG TPA: glycosyltransferase [Bryobacteraceae bacterium]|nr:glycosyltransferase [Bryobacteraceae bacterium]
MTVGYFAPLPPARTGVADYAASLLAELRKHGRVETAPAACDVALYHLGNNGLHAAIYRRALAQPGVVVLHDAVLHHFLLGQLDEDGYVEEFVYNYGEWHRELARELWRGRASSGTDPRYFEYPMLKRVAEGARSVVVHNPAAAQMVRDHAPGARVVEIPHLFAPPELPGESETMRYRQRLGVDPGTFLFGVFGYLRASKRLVTVLEAFAQIHRENPRTALLVAGQFVSPDLERAVAPMLAGDGVLRQSYLADREFWLAARAVDACINLRYPAAGETSGIAIRLMGIGKPVMVTDSLECARFPEDACVRIAPGVAELESLREHMVLLTSMGEVASAVGERGAGHVRAHHGVEQVGKKYWALLCELCS